jgi:hypothetical protein
MSESDMFPSPWNETGKIDLSKINPEMDMNWTKEGVENDFGKYLGKMSHEAISVLHKWAGHHKHDDSCFNSHFNLCDLMADVVNQEFQERIDDAYRAMEEIDRENRKNSLRGER